ncbi:unnamed protein product [Cochlearia groenlandica]
MNIEEQEEDMEMSGVNPHGGYDSLSGEGATSSGGGGRGGGGKKKDFEGKIKYRECLKNHALNIGGHAVDGCCEFMPLGEDGSLDALKCAACGCHRNFHRKETENAGRAHRVPTYYNRPPHLPPPGGYLHQISHGAAAAGQLYRPPVASADEEDTSNPSSSGGGGTTGKRFRTKFTAEQKEKMLAFAERLGWRIQKHDDMAVEQFCMETGVRRQVLKIWMHNNKNSLGKKP